MPRFDLSIFQSFNLSIFQSLIFEIFHSYPASSPYFLQGATSNDGQCIQCVPGYFKATAGATSCDACDVGRYQGSSGALDCVDCEVGRYNPVAGVGLCAYCPPGTFVETVKSTSLSQCLGCFSGQYAALEGSSACKWR